jgi:glycosyltransferase involved in cell wall biosynthesis
MGEAEKKICFVHGGGYNAFRKESVGGTQLQLYYISKALAKGNYDVKFITDVDEPKEIEGVKLIPGSGRTDNPISKFFTGLRITYSLFKVDTDVFFSSNINIDVFLIALTSVFRRKKHIHRTVHEVQMSKDFMSESPVRWFLNHLGLRQADFIFTQSKDHYKKLSDWFNPALGILPNSFPIPEKKQKKGDYVLWVGRRVEWKKPELALKLAEEFSSEKFVIISPRTSSEEDFYNKIERKAERLSNVELIERVPREKIQNYFDNAKIFLNTSENEGFPNTFVEAGIGGTPILSYIVDPDSFIENKECGFSCRGNYSELKSRMNEMLQNEKETERMGENCRNYVEKNHDITKNIQKVEKEIERLLEN